MDEQHEVGRKGFEAAVSAAHIRAAAALQRAVHGLPQATSFLVIFVTSKAILLNYDFLGREDAK